MHEGRVRVANTSLPTHGINTSPPAQMSDT